MGIAERKKNSSSPCTFNMTTIGMHSFSELLFFRMSMRKRKMAKIAIKISKANYAKMAINFLFRKLYRFDTYRQNNSDFFSILNAAHLRNSFSGKYHSALLNLYFYWYPYSLRRFELWFHDDWHWNRFKWSQFTRWTASCNISCEHVVFEEQTRIRQTKKKFALFVKELFNCYIFGLGLNLLRPKHFTQNGFLFSAYLMNKKNRSRPPFNDKISVCIHDTFWSWSKSESKCPIVNRKTMISLKYCT